MDWVPAQLSLDMEGRRIFDTALGILIGLRRCSSDASSTLTRKQAIAYLVPGVILQPSGVFAAIRAQEAGATYLRAS